MIYGTLILCFCLYWVNVPIEVYYCMPRRGQAWSDRTVFERCASSIIFGVARGGFNIPFDLWLMIIPFRVI